MNYNQVFYPHHHRVVPFPLKYYVDRLEVPPSLDYKPVAWIVLFFNNAYIPKINTHAIVL